MGGLIVPPSFEDKYFKTQEHMTSILSGPALDLSSLGIPSTASSPNPTFPGVKSELAVLKNNPFKAPTYRYPLDLGEAGQEPYIIFDVRSSAANQNAGASLGTIALYMPTEIKANYTLAYENLTLDFSRYLSIGESIWTTAQKAWRGNFAQVLDDIKTGLVRNGAMALDQMTQANAQVLAEMKMGMLANPHQAVVFKGVSFRDFSFSFTFQPRNEKESTEIQNIIYKFKYHAHPATTAPDGTTGTRFWYYPENFVIGLFSPEDRYLFKISVCALKSVDVNYAGSDVPSFFTRTGAPVDVRLTLSFRELEQLSKERIAQGY